MSCLWRNKDWSPKGKHCYVTGGSAGLGLALALMLAKDGAHISIVARRQEKLDDAMARIEKARQSPSQIFQSFSFSLASSEQSKKALEAVCQAHGGQAPDAVFLCAGASTPKFFVEMSEDDLTDGMSDGYWVQAWSAWAATKMMTRQSRKGKIVFVSSTLGYMTLIGYASYSPAKHALRGLADSLRSELLLYDIDVHIFFPNTMLTESYERENLTKPKITLEIEETDTPVSAEHAAKSMLKGVKRGQAHIAGDLLTNLFRVSARSASPTNNVIVDTFLSFIAWIGIPIWMSGVNAKIRGHRDEHRKYLTDKKYYQRLDSLEE